MIKTFSGIIVLVFCLTTSLQGQPAAKIWFGSVTAEPDSEIALPIFVSTDSAITLAQFIIEFDSTVIVPISPIAEIGTSVSGFSINNTNTNLPFDASASGTNKNVLVQISGEGSNVFSGDSLEVVKLVFQVVGNYLSKTPLHFDEDGSHTFLSTENLNDLKGEAIDFGVGEMSIDDFTRPAAFELLEPPDNSWTKESSPTFSWSPSSDAVSGLASYALFINDELNVDGISPSQTSIAPAQKLGDGEYSWNVKAQDSAGNVRESTSTWLLRVDTTPPISAITNPTEGEEVSGTIIIEGTANDGSGIGVDMVFVSTDSGATWHPATNTGEDFSTWQYEWNVLQDGPITLLTKAVDKLGNEETPHDITVTDVEDIGSKETPTEFGLFQNYPNPFNPETKIQYDLPKSTHVTLEIFNLLGQKIRTLVDEEKPAGSYAVVWDGRKDNGEAVVSGVYIYRLTSDGFVKSRKLLLLR